MEVKLVQVPDRLFQTYEFTCDNCGYDFERTIMFKHLNLVTCEKCNTLARRRFSSDVGVSWDWVIDGLTHDKARRTHDPYEL